MGVPSGAAIASDGLKYQGARYTYGGRADVPGDWDCSSFVSYVLGKDLGMVLPGGGHYGDAAYPPNVHGPVVAAYAGWDGATTLPPGQPPAAGDMCVWNGLGPLGHIGIATDSAHMISALDTTDGTVHTPIAGYGPAGVPVMFRRINGTAELTAGSSGSTAGDANAVLLAGLAGAAAPVAMASLLIGVAMLAGLAGAAVAVLVAVRARG